MWFTSCDNGQSKLLPIMLDFYRGSTLGEGRGGDRHRQTESDTNQIIVWHNSEFWMVCSNLAGPSCKLQTPDLMSTGSRSLIFWKLEENLVGSETWSLFSSAMINPGSKKNDTTAPRLQLARNILPGVIQKLLWPWLWLLVQLGRDVRHWKCLEFGRISVVNCCSRSLEEPKNSFDFFFS